MTITRQMTTRSSSKYIPSHSMTTRSGMIYKSSVATNKKKHATRLHTSQPIVKESAAPHDDTPPTTTTLGHPEFVPIAYRAIVEVLELYHNTPNDVYLEYLQEAVSLTARLHNHFLSPSPTTEVNVTDDRQVSEDSDGVDEELDVNIDFDDAHNCWMENKRKLNGQYVYMCGYTLKNKKKCRAQTFDKIGLCSGCKTHYMWEEKLNKYDVDVV